LIKKEGAWKIYDIAFEDIHYSENIREQIQAFLSENKAKGFANLLEKLRKKKSELKS
jgi:ABC-type transporter MlaC component